MQKLWQTKLKLQYSKEVLDIVQFGSSVLEESNPKDIDIAVIFDKTPIKNIARGVYLKTLVQSPEALIIFRYLYSGFILATAGFHPNISILN